VRKSREEAAQTRKRIVTAAAGGFRKHGIAASGLNDLMKAAGLTHGGFYKHFGSRDDLIAEAVDRAFADSQEAVAAVTEGTDDRLAAFVNWYVSDEHRDNPASGCGVVALGGEVARGDARVRAAYTEQVKRYLALLEELLGDPNPETRRQATVMLCTLVGSILVARAVDDPELSDEIIDDVRARLTSS
jgi:TetR/AcrR family transcriptional regulator, transcriptional repressor for nem operon